MISFPNKKYSVIYADPPWSYKTWSAKGTGRSAEQHYKTMSKDDIKALPIQNISEDNSVLFLWATYPTLPQAIETMEAWGFIYKTVAFTWVKRTKHDKEFVGLGHYTRANPEICLLGTKGKPLPRVSRSVRNLVVSKIREHSRKPDEVGERIIELFGDQTRIELFARRERNGYDVWGNEVGV